jgi:beta-lactamase regulating signal transducer with metallopeptidase domain/ankyrin repeat protein
MADLVLPTLVDLSLRTTVLLGLAFALTLLMRRAAASTRHAVWACAVVAVALLPALYALVPGWQIASPPALARVSSALTAPSTPVIAARDLARQNAAPDGADRPEDAGAPSASAPVLSWPAVAIALWAAGAVCVAAYMLLGIAAASRIRRVAAPSAAGDEVQELAEALAIPGPVAVVESATRTMPIVCGLWRPLIVMPATAAEWPDERRHVVTLHELAHIKRRDCLTQAIAHLVCAAYWFNPIVWIAARRLRVERERACDDFVLAAGIRGSDYANHLLGIAQGEPRARLSPLAAAGVAMARRSQLEGRLMAILDPAIRRSSARPARAAIAVGLLTLSLPLAALRPQAAVRAPDMQLAADRSLSRTAVPADPEAGVAVPSLPTPVPRAAAAAPQDPVRAAQDAVLRRTLNATLLEFAHEGHIDGVLAMLAAGADVNAVVDGDGSPLIAAASEGHVDVVRLLLDKGAEPNLAVDGDGSALIAAADEGYVDVVRLLLDRNADPNLVVPGDGSALIAAASEGHADVVQLLLERGADVNLIAEGDENALIQASGEAHLDIVKLLVSRGADVNAGVWVERSINVRASIFRNSDFDRFENVRIQSDGPELRTPLSVARREGNVDIVTYLISVGARE